MVRSPFSRARDRSRIDPAPGTALDPTRALRPCIQRPALDSTSRGPFGLVLAPRISPWFQSAKILHPLPEPAGGVVILEPLWERPAGTQTHSRRTGSKLGQTRRTRQGLVRLSESNTKYGGKRGITGTSAAPVIASSISESSGIRKPKKYPRSGLLHFTPLCTGQDFVGHLLGTWACV